MESMNLELGFETEVFLLSCLLGAGLGVVYDILKVFRNTVGHNKIVIFVEDFIYAILFGFGYFTFCVGLTGKIRGFIIFGMIVGCIIETKTLGSFVVTFLTKFFDVVFRFTFAPIGKILSKIFSSINRLIVKKKLIFTKNKKKVKKPLKV